MLPPAKPTKKAIRPVTILAGSILGMGIILSPAPDGIPTGAWQTLGVALWMIFWWLTEAIPVSATAFLPLILFPVLGLSDFKETAAPYAHPLIFLFLGGFIIAKGLETWNLHRRIALLIVQAFGTRPDYLIAGFMLATAALSMWVSNTATTVMMLPIALSIIRVLSEEESEKANRGTATALLLGIAYAANIGGIGTLIGTPPNALLAAFVEEHLAIELGFAEWMAIGLPLVCVMLPLTWLLLTRAIFSISKSPLHISDRIIKSEREALGPMSIEEKRVLAIFILTALCWIFRPLISSYFPQLNLSDPIIALIGALFMFITPAGKGSGRALVSWRQAASLPWGVLILFGGGLSLAGAISKNELADLIGNSLASLQNYPVLILIAAVTTMIVFLTEFISNTAATAIFLPIVATIAIGAGIPPMVLLLPVALAASCAFMMPVATPPNAIVFASEKLTVLQMAKAGFLLNLIAISVIVFASWVFGL